MVDVELPPAPWLLLVNVISSVKLKAVLKAIGAVNAALWQT